VNENSAYLQRKRRLDALGADEPAPFDSEAT
jgi:sec-independent protein translocase protein TatB